MRRPRRSALVVIALLTGAALLAPPASRQAAAQACPVAPYGVQTSAPGTGKTVALTFDGGPGVSTEAILRILGDNGVTATFFNIGEYLANAPATVRAEAAGGYLLGNHTWDHPHMTTLPPAGQADQMDRYNAEQTSLVGFPACVFRPPFGEYNSTTLSVAQSRNMSVWNWSVDTIDWQEEGSSSPESINRIITRAEAGGSLSHPVILMHNGPVGNPATVAALPAIITFYRDRGYTFVDLAGRVGNRPPFGAYDSAQANGTGAITVRGWTIDPDTPTVPTRVHVYVDGRGAASISANLSRPDVGRVYPWAGALHGFGVAVPADPGVHSLCVYAIDTSFSNLHTALGCRTATVP